MALCLGEKTPSQNEDAKMREGVKTAQMVILVLLMAMLDETLLFDICSKFC